jgi:hypothetical protein
MLWFTASETFATHDAGVDEPQAQGVEGTDVTDAIGADTGVVPLNTPSPKRTGPLNAPHFAVTVIVKAQGLAPACGPGRQTSYGIVFLTKR